ncbi:MAG: hypothetical protein QF662_05660, partial [Phycisphaerae bacterium]|nr:hypothetical protein [Phycisphaerae bacterium]
MRIATAKGRTVVRELPFPQSVEAVFLHLANRPHVCWLDSAPSGDASGGPRDLSRWSVLTSDPVAVLTSDRGSNLLEDSSGRRLEASAGS